MGSVYKQWTISSLQFISFISTLFKINEATKLYICRIPSDLIHVSVDSYI
jgi:hypothetical protein